MKDSQDKLSKVESDFQRLSEEQATSQSAWVEREGVMREECGRLEGRVEELIQQNALLYEEADKVCVCVTVSLGTRLVWCHCC